MLSVLIDSLSASVNLAPCCISGRAFLSQPTTLPTRRLGGSGDSWIGGRFMNYTLPSRCVALSCVCSSHGRRVTMLNSRCRLGSTSRLNGLAGRRCLIRTRRWLRRCHQGLRDYFIAPPLRTIPGLASPRWPCCNRLSEGILSFIECSHRLVRCSLLVQPLL